MTGPACCRIGKVSQPIRWEHVPEPEPAEGPDPLLWFEAPCGGRDLLVGSGGTYPGRMSAWCPDKKVGYNVSLAEAVMPLGPYRSVTARTGERRADEVT